MVKASVAGPMNTEEGRVERDGRLMEEKQMSQVRRPVAAVLSLASTVLVGGVAWGLAAKADDTTASVQGAAATTAAAELPPAAAPAARTAVPATRAARAPKAAPGKSAAAAAVTPVPGTPAAAKLTVPTTVTIQAISKTVSEAQMYRAIFRGVLTATPKKQALPQQSVVLMVRVKGASAWTRAVTAVSSAPDGKLLVAVSQSAASADYRFVFDAKAPYKASSSGIVTVTRG